MFLNIFKSDGLIVHHIYKQDLQNSYMKKGIIILIVAIIVVVIIGGVVGYLYFSGAFNHKNPRFPPRGGQFNISRNIQLNQSQIDEVTSFFAVNPTQQQITDYCNTNRMNCFYYCRNIDQNNNYCKELTAQRPGNNTQDGMRNPNGPYGNQTMPNGPGPGGEMPPQGGIPQ
jgi:hypothetical protein